MSCQVLPLLLELQFVLPKQLLDFFLFTIDKFFCFMTNVIGREECSTAHWIYIVRHFLSHNLSIIQ
jgi:hypothetical protein